MICFLAVLFVSSAWTVSSKREPLRKKRETVARLGLSDLCLFTDARYARHPAIADLFSPFQDHPRSLEHFPSGSLVGPPDHVRRYDMGR